MRKNMIIDHKNKKILLCRDFENKSKNAESGEFKQLCDIVKIFPSYDIVRREIAKKKNKEAYKGLTYGYMEAYIDLHGRLDIMQEYKELRLLAECHSIRYPVIKAWFLEKFPEVKLYGVRIDAEPDLKQSA